MGEEAELREAQRAFRTRLLDEDTRPNVVGLAVGVTHREGRPTGRCGLLVLVTRKVADSDLPRHARIPARIGGFDTDVLEVGNARSGPGPVFAGHQDPAYGGCGIGHVAGTVGTLTAAVHDRRRRGGPGDGLLSLLGTNHILGDLNRGTAGDPILQPSRFDGGELPGDEIGRLIRSVPIDLEPPLPRHLHRNVVDAAVADATSPRVRPGVHGLRRLAAHHASPRTGTRVRKMGRSTGLTTGRIIATCATVDIRYGAMVARFHDQIVTTPLIESGDSGALLVGDDCAPIGLLFAGGTGASFANPIERVASLLEIKIAVGTGPFPAPGR